VIALLLLVGEALARAGGGHGYSGGGSSGGGYSGGGGSSGSGGDGLGLLLWLVIEQPCIGVPLVIVVVVFLVMQNRNRGNARTVYRSQPAETPMRRAAADPSFLLALDPNFSQPLFLDLARLVYTRAQEERGRRNWAALRPFVSDTVIAALERRGNVKEVREVIIGAAGLSRAELRGDAAVLTVAIDANYTEVTDTERQWLVRESWTFSRVAATPSPGPDRMRTLACPNCGNPSDTRADGTCTRCDAVVVDGRLQWQVTDATLVDRQPLARIVLAPGGGVEEGTRNPTITAPDLSAQMRRFTARHADFEWPAFRARVEETFRRIQAAWSVGDAATLRPLETDFLYQQHRYWLERYKRERLRNRVEEVQVGDVVPAKLTMDAYLEAITVRVFASVRDWTEDANGKVVGGSKDYQRVFSEYWTFLRSTGSTSKAVDLDHCPSCGAPLDRVNESGVCGYCEAKVTGGEFDWVLSTIDQDDGYRG
jgi:predicted lipid-binding transport protein (Tim44 family)